ncbi:hypothetical protein DFH09DRAFT_1346758 [Mycena vulgaris]|nr:hypothetical protein DFH09DRAFT_1346758 [Mycena vulgaris]
MNAFGPNPPPAGPQPNWAALGGAFQTLATEIPLMQNVNIAQQFQQILIQLNTINNRIGGIDNRLTGMDNRLTGMDASLTGIRNKIDTNDQLALMRMHNASTSTDAPITFPQGFNPGAPVTKAEAINFTGIQAQNYANAMGLPALPAGSSAHAHKVQLLSHLGIFI